MSMLPPDLVERVNQMSALTKSLQSKVDKQGADKSGKRKWDAPNDGSEDIKGTKGKAKGKGKGNGKFKKFRGPRRGANNQ